MDSRSRDDALLISTAEQRALDLLTRALSDTTPAEARQSRRLGRLIADDSGRDLLLDLTDQVLRIRQPRRSARRLHDLVRGGVSRALGTVDRLGLLTLGAVAPAIPGLARWAVDWRVDRDTSGVILSAEPDRLGGYIARRTDDGFALNINLLGEAILGDDEATARYEQVCALMRRPDIDYVSIKISAMCANLDVLAWDDSLARIDERLCALYRLSLETGTFVNLDMEEHRDLDLSVTAFIAALDRPEFAGLSAGIVLQGYMPDSHGELHRLLTWAGARRRAGGAPIKIRLVKGANLAMEQIEAEQRGWPLAPYGSKADVDASYKRMLDTVIEHAEPGSVRIGIASHNLFDIAWAMTRREQLPDPRMIEFEMLEGMAPAQSRATRDAAGGLLFYAPVVADVDRDASIAYLSRRLDENSSPENFLRSLFDITPGSAAWEHEQSRFRTSVSSRHSVPTSTHRTQDRRTESIAFTSDGSFSNVPDTDFTTPGNRAWARGIYEMPRPAEPPLITTTAGVDALVARALQAQREWAATSWQERRDALARVAASMERRRGQTLAALMTTTGKVLREGDPEVSEAIDFTTYASHLTLAHEELSRELRWEPSRVVLVAGPWNFPYAIPACGLVHAIAAGGAAILKPAPEARAVGALLVEHIVAAGLPEGLVQLACTPDDEVGLHLVGHADIEAVVLTGSRATAELFHGVRPGLRLYAETSGKNALVITAAADIDSAIKDLVKSAFGHAGQKCSAASLAIVEGAVYDDPSFARRLSDAAASMKVGPAEDPSTIIGPVIAPPSGSLLRGLTELDPGESWLVQPRQLDEAGHLWSPGIRWGVRPGSWFHQTECFGPVLGIMRAANLDEAIDLQNATDYGLTGGVHSLDPKEIDRWVSRVEVGNAYVNRHITGAIVQRQPFGGWKHSTVGGGGKPGGPAHLSNYGTWFDDAPDLPRATRSLLAAQADLLARDADPANLLSEANLLRHHGLRHVVVRHDESLDPVRRGILAEAARLAGSSITWSSTQNESDEALAARLGDLAPLRMRLLAPAGDRLLSAAHRRGIAVDRTPVTSSGQIELGRWTREQSISITMHRHGRLLARPVTRVGRPDQSEPRSH